MLRTIPPWLFALPASALLLACEANTPTASPARDASPPPAAEQSDASPPPTAAQRTDAKTAAAPPLQAPPAEPFDDSACKPAAVHKDCKDGFCNIPAGCFVMGSPEDEWSHAPLAEKCTIVTLTHSFAIQEHEVTRGEWIAHGLPDPNGRLTNGMGDCSDDELCPVGNVSWFEAVSYANLLSEQHVPKLAPCYKLFDCTGQVGRDFVCKRAALAVDNMYDCPGFRLPNDAEWEYAARAGTRSAVYTGNVAWLSDLGECNSEPALEEIAWYCNNSGGLTHPVAQRTPNAWGLYDMIGNASEWVNDYASGLPPATPRDPGAQLEPNPDKQLHPARNIRGCSYNGWSGICRAAFQYAAPWDSRGPGIGFRLVRSAL